LGAFDKLKHPITNSPNPKHNKTPVVFSLYTTGALFAPKPYLPNAHFHAMIKK
jgi:hypothetical protein